MPPQGPSPALFFDTISAYQRTEALRAAIELDLFSHVAAGRQTATELAECVPGRAAWHPHTGRLSHHPRLPSQARRPLRTHRRRKGVSRSQVAGLSGRRA